MAVTLNCFLGIVFGLVLVKARVISFRFFVIGEIVSLLGWVMLLEFIAKGAGK